MSTPEAILCIDLDGTLLDPQEKIHSQDIKILENFPDKIQPVITTGRNINSTISVFYQNGLNKFRVLPWPGVFMNGGAGFLPEEKCIIRHCFTEKLRRELVSLTFAFTKSSFAFFTINAVHLVNPNSFSKYIDRIHYLNAIETLAWDIPDEIIKLMILEQDPDVLRTIQKETLGWKAEMGYTLPYAYEINPAGITKANTLVTLLEALNLSKIPIFVTGDADNDLSLFALAQKSFAPSSAHKAVRERAGRIIHRKYCGLLTPILQELN